MTKREILTATDFGKRIAEEEGDVLETYFVETDQWRKVFAGDIDIVYGPKGSGKSAIYFLLLKKEAELANRQIKVIACEELRGTPIFRTLVNESTASEEKLNGLWKLYFLSVIGQSFRSLRLNNSYASQVTEFLENNKLILQDGSLKRIFGSVRDYIKRLEASAEISIDPVTGLPQTLRGKITLSEPTPEVVKEVPIPYVQFEHNGTEQEIEREFRLQ